MCGAGRLSARSGLGADFRIASKEPAGQRGQGGPFLGGRTVWPPPSPVLSGSVFVLPSWWPSQTCTFTEAFGGS